MRTYLEWAWELLKLMALGAVSVVIAIVILGHIATAHGQTATPDALREYKKELLRLQATEFCANVKLPPRQFIMNIQAGVQAGSPEAKALWEWLAPILEHYTEVGCGDA